MNKNKNANIVVYGKNCNDETAYNKYNYLKKCGFINIYLYSGGIFEWLLLNEIYGSENFPVNNIELDILKYKSEKNFNNLLLTDT